MAKKAQARDYVTLECTECGEQNYRTSKRLKGGTARLELKKFCRRDRRHTLHKERRK
ncbi:MAG TPA: 50S ribosomal protein L33 [Planctomycetota bacterium]|nr:50S ribosomal protein L33 [Planctomycetota bacterium]